MSELKTFVPPPPAGLLLLVLRFPSKNTSRDADFCIVKETIQHLFFGLEIKAVITSD